MGAKPRYPATYPTPKSSAPNNAVIARALTARIEKFREVGIRLDRQGSFWHQGTQISHPRITLALLKWLDVRDTDQRPILRFDENRYAYVDVDEAMLLIVSVHWDDDHPQAILNDGSREPLAVDALYVGPDSAIYTVARGRRLSARLTPRATQSLSGHLDEIAKAGQNQFVIHADGCTYPIGTIDHPRQLLGRFG